MREDYPRCVRRAFRISACAAVVAWLGCGCEFDAQIEPYVPPDNYARVIVLDTELLSPAPIGDADVQAPDRWIALNPEDAKGERAAQFYITVATDQPDKLVLRLTSAQSGSAARLRRVAKPTASKVTAFISRPQDGSYWLADPGPETGPLTHRVGVMVSESLLRANTWLDVFATEADDDVPLYGDRIRLARGFFYMATLGDSAMWGNGLTDEDKFSTKVARQIELETGKRVIRFDHALSGATILSGEDVSICLDPCFGEVPTGLTPITMQADMLVHPELMDLVLMDGCGNDIGISSIISPTTDLVELEARTREFCGAAMIGLLEQVRSAAPQARLVVTGYFPMLSMESIESGATELAIVVGISGEDLAEVEDPLVAMAANSEVFHRVSGESLAAAVATVNSRIAGEPMIAFADAGYGPQNAMFASDPWLWEMQANPELESIFGLGIRLFPEDPLLDLRWELCGEPDVAADWVSCLYASVAHPNPAGARAYTDAIVTALRDLGVLPEQQ